MHRELKLLPLMRPGTVLSCCQGETEGATTLSVCLEVKAAGILFSSIPQFNSSRPMKIPRQGHPPALVRDGLRW